MMTDVPTALLQITPHTMTSECHCEGSQLKYILPYQFVINAMISILGYGIYPFFFFLNYT